MNDPLFIQVLSFLDKPTKLTEIDLKARNISDGEIQALLEAMKKGNGNKIVTLNLINNHIRSSGALALADIVRCHPSLTKIQLQKNDIGSTGSIAIANALVDDRCVLKRLHMKACNIGSLGASAISVALEREGCSLEDLRVEQNDIGNDGVCAIASAISRNSKSNLCNLELKMNMIGWKGAHCIAECLRSNKSLQTLGLNDNPLGPSGIEEIADALRSNCTLNWLFLSNSEKEQKICRRGVEALCHTLYDESSPDAVYTSNHTLKEIYGVPQNIQEKLRRLLRFNKLGKYKARREKISLFLNENHTFLKSSGFNQILVPRILQRGGYHSLDTMYRHIRESPDVVPCVKYDTRERHKATLRDNIRSWRRSTQKKPGQIFDPSLAGLDAALSKHRLA